MIRDCFVIAELGVNWRNLHQADKLIRDCAWAGADAVKFQMYNEEQIKDAPDYPFLRHIMLKKPDIRYLYWRCKYHDIEFMCTPMYPEAVDILDPYVERWKVRYADRENEDIISRMFTGHDKQILISHHEVPAIREWRHIKYLYCVPEYPPTKCGFDEFQSRYLNKGFDGVSCHWPNIEIAMYFVKNGARFLEMHVKDEDEDYCPVDNAVSITICELKKLIDWMRSE